MAWAFKCAVSPALSQAIGRCLNGSQGEVEEGIGRYEHRRTRILLRPIKPWNCISMAHVSEFK